MFETIIPVFTPMIEALAGKYGVLAQVLIAMGLARLCMKPIMAAAGEVVKITPSTKDDEFLGKLLASPIYKSICFVLDWTLSLKLPKK